VQDKSGQTALHLAIIFRQLREARILLRNAAPTFITDKNGKSPLDYCSSLEEAFELKSKNESFALLTSLALALQNDIFISYAHTDIEFTRKLRESLERHCLRWQVLALFQTNH
jgi:hypothetical protein